MASGPAASNGFHPVARQCRTGGAPCGDGGRRRRRRNRGRSEWSREIHDGGRIPRRRLRRARGRHGRARAHRRRMGRPQHPCHGEDAHRHGAAGSRARERGDLVEWDLGGRVRPLPERSAPRVRAAKRARWRDPLPKLSDRTTSEVEPIRTGPALAVLTGTTLSLQPGEVASGFEQVSALADDVPAFRLHVGRDPATIPDAIASLLAKLGAA